MKTNKNLTPEARKRLADMPKKPGSSGASTGGSRGPITQPGPMPRPPIAGPRPGIPPRDIGLGNGPRGTGGIPRPGIKIDPANPRPTMMKKGGKVSSASKRGDGCAIKGKTKGRMV